MILSFSGIDICSLEKANMRKASNVIDKINIITFVRESISFFNLYSPLLKFLYYQYYNKNQILFSTLLTSYDKVKEMADKVLSSAIIKPSALRYLSLPLRDNSHCMDSTITFSGR